MGKQKNRVPATMGNMWKQTERIPGTKGVTLYPTVREFLQLRLKMQGYETYEAVDGLAALELIEKVTPDLVLTELNLYGIDGLPFIHHIQNNGREFSTVAVEGVTLIPWLTDRATKKVF